MQISKKLISEHIPNWKEPIDYRQFINYDFPKFKFPIDWEVEIVPTFAEAAYRFFVHKNNKMVSIYFDTDSKLGTMNEVYYEIYLTNQPVKKRRKSPQRFFVNETKKMLKAIDKLLK